MFYIADLHTHSKYAGATSPDLCLETLYQWALIKGIDVVSTGDFTHPAWLKELEEKLQPSGTRMCSCFVHVTKSFEENPSKNTCCSYGAE